MRGRVVLLGAPNAGKSTLFNRLAGRKLALTLDAPGLTRDWKSATARAGGYEFEAVDTAGYELGGDETSRLMREGSLGAVREGDGILLVVDGYRGVTREDERLAQWVRKGGYAALVCVTKCDAKEAKRRASEGWRLGFGEPVETSAEHGLGFEDLGERLRILGFTGEDDDEDAGEAGVLRLAVLGRPNVGKSTLVNNLAGEARVLSSCEPGTTRDPISVRVGEWEVTDTAGVRREVRREDGREDLAARAALEAVRGSEVAALVMDARSLWERQELRLAGFAAEAGRGLVCVLNKMDLLGRKERKTALSRARKMGGALAPVVRGTSYVSASALEGWGVEDILSAGRRTRGVWSRRMRGGELNRWLREAVEKTAAPSPGGRELRLKYAAQTGTRPPRFCVFVNRPYAMTQSYRRYLVSSLRERFELWGTPLELEVRATANPYGGGGKLRR